MEISRAMTKDLPDERGTNTLPFPSLDASRAARRGGARTALCNAGSDPRKGKKKKGDADGDDDVESPGVPERGESRGGDLFQLYLHQMTEIRLLPREEELWLAKQIDHHRKRLRAKLYESPIALGEILPILEGLEEGSLLPARVV